MTATLVERIIEHVEAETEGLRAGGFDVHASSLRKHRLLLDLHHSRNAPGVAELERLRAALARNGDELSAQLAASRTVADLAIGIVRDDGCDGTYSASPRRTPR